VTSRWPWRVPIPAAENLDAAAPVDSRQVGGAGSTGIRHAGLRPAAHGSVGTMSDGGAARTVLADLFDRIRELVVELTDNLTDEEGRFRPDPEANSIAWLLWHSARVQDDHIADLAGVEQRWPAWRERFALPFDDFATGYAQTSDEVGKVRVSGDLLAEYQADVDALTRRYLETLDAEELERIVDTRWDPPVTASARLVSVVGDLQQHLGQAAYVLGMVRRRDQAWHAPGVADH
jgi:hypothetical protein